MKGTILVVDDERSIRVGLRGLLGKEGYDVSIAESGEEALQLIARQSFDVVLTDLRMPGVDGISLLKQIKDRYPETVVVMMTAYGSEKIAVEAMKSGAHDYLVKPFDNEEVKILVRQVLEQCALRREVRHLHERLDAAFRFDKILGTGPAMQRIFDTVKKVAATDLTVLITGESGTGKELVANALHQNSPRKGGSFIKVNCAALARELVESELFGHEKGSFTGAIAAREGKFEAADGGTIFLDEIGDMSMKTQAKVLRVLQEQVTEPVGSTSRVQVDVRVLAATNKDLLAEIRAGRFREDLYFRLNVVDIVVPPLRERGEDILRLARGFLGFFAAAAGGRPKVLTAEAEAALSTYAWPGNVRELRNAMERAVILWPGDLVAAAALPERIAGHAQLRPRVGDDVTLAELEREHILAVVERTATLEDAARILGIDASTLWRKRKQYGAE